MNMKPVHFAAVCPAVKGVAIQSRSTRGTGGAIALDSLEIRYPELMRLRHEALRFDNEKVFIPFSNGTTCVLEFLNFSGFVRETKKLVEAAKRNALYNIPEELSEPDKRILRKRLKDINVDFLVKQIIIKTLQDSIQNKAKVYTRKIGGEPVAFLVTESLRIPNSHMPSPGLTDGHYLIRLKPMPEQRAEVDIQASTRVKQHSEKIGHPTDWQLRVSRNPANQKISYKLFPQLEYVNHGSELLGERGVKPR